MSPSPLLEVSTREGWRFWLAEHHASATEIWLVSWRKSTGRPSVPYNDAVEEALCFGWIDSVRRTVDETRYAHRYTPRRARSSFSQTNKERLARLLAADRVHPDVRAGLPDIDPSTYVMPADILDALRADPRAWAFFQGTAPSYRRIRVAYVDTARGRGDAFEKRLAHLVAKCAAGKHFGYDIEAYY